jgi:hypothetical protein
MLYPITFSIPEIKITALSDLPEKRKLLSTIIPGDKSTYTFANEEDYYNEYRQSMFAITMRKSGWDCMRHYEIIANGCIPFFQNLEECPVNTMALLPKDLLAEANTLYNKFTKSPERTKELMDEYDALNGALQAFLRENLTTRAMANYVLERTRHRKVSSVLFLSGNLFPDYLRCLTLHGFKELFGAKCHDYPRVSHMYQSENIDYRRLYGMGMTYSDTLAPELHDSDSDRTIEEDIRNKKYDIVIYGSYHRGVPFYELVSKIYRPSEIIMLCGEDIHKCSHKDFFLSRGHHLFIREL